MKLFTSGMSFNWRNVIYYICFTVVLAATLINLVNVGNSLLGNAKLILPPLETYISILGNPLPLLLFILPPSESSNAINTSIIVGALFLIRRAYLIMVSRENKIPSGFSGFLNALLLTITYVFPLSLILMRADFFLKTGILGIFGFLGLAFAALTLTPTLILIEIVSISKEVSK
jgi:hypothetical protein